MRILVGCEESGKVRDEFIALGHEAISCDIIPARNGGPHLQMDIEEAIKKHGPWDQIILFIPCTALANSGNGTYGRGKPKYYLRQQSLWWSDYIWDLAKSYARVGAAVENPVSMLWGLIGKPQYIQPWMFGHKEQKKTGILTDRLPKLIPTDIVPGPYEQRVWKMGPSPTRARDRSETYSGIARAMAQQWGGLNANTVS